VRAQKKAGQITDDFNLDPALSMASPNADEIWVFIADPLRINLRIFNSWVCGLKGTTIRRIRNIKPVIIMSVNSAESGATTAQEYEGDCYG
jgi:hypothetical protein